MKTVKCLDLFTRLVIYKEKLSINFIISEFEISERTLYYYIGDINEVIRINMGLEVVVRNKIVQVIIFE